MAQYDLNIDWPSYPIKDNILYTGVFETVNGVEKQVATVQPNQVHVIIITTVPGIHQYDIKIYESFDLTLPYVNYTWVYYTSVIANAVLEQPIPPTPGPSPSPSPPLPVPPPPSQSPSPIPTPPPVKIDSQWGVVPGPWAFSPQLNKWGYLNNPRWQQNGRDPALDNYDGRESQEPQIWTMPNASIKYSAGNQVKHSLCGHWHNPSPPPPILLQGFVKNGVINIPLSGTFPNANTAGNTLVVVCATASAYNLTIVDSLGNVYPASFMTYALSPGPFLSRIWAWIVPKCKAGINTITVTANSFDGMSSIHPKIAAGDIFLSAIEVSGVGTLIGNSWNQNNIGASETPQQVQTGSLSISRSSILISIFLKQSYYHSTLPDVQGYYPVNMILSDLTNPYPLYLFGNSTSTDGSGDYGGIVFGLLADATSLSPLFSPGTYVDKSTTGNATILATHNYFYSGLLSFNPLT
jgi:hypothetical protein